ncbi:hypothetical protein FNU77_18220 [Prescottella equi]|nr:hypothetical protein FNU77_18220 [Prescottella equi]
MTARAPSPVRRCRWTWASRRSRRLRHPCAFLVGPATKKAHGREAPTGCRAAPAHVRSRGTGPGSCPCRTRASRAAR